MSWILDLKRLQYEQNTNHSIDSNHEFGPTICLVFQNTRNPEHFWDFYHKNRLRYFHVALILNNRAMHGEVVFVIAPTLKEGSCCIPFFFESQAATAVSHGSQAAVGASVGKGDIR